MTALAVCWWLIVTAPHDSLGRQMGPFASAQQCEIARAAFEGDRGTNRLRLAACVQGVR